MRVHLKDRRTEAPDAMSFIFDLAGKPFVYRPGQFAYFVLDKLAFPDERGPVRHFTISSAPTEPGIVMFTTRLRGSGYKETLRQAPLGLEVTLKPASGDFVLPAGKTQRHVFIAGGIGITPFRSMLRFAVDTGKPLDARLLYFNRSPEAVVFQSELENFARQMPTFSMEIVYDEPAPAEQEKKESRRESAVRRYVKDPGKTLFWVSGPPAMAEAYAAMLERLGVPADSIRSEGLAGYEPEEVFGVPASAGSGIKPARSRKSAKERTMANLSFAADILPLFRKFDLDSMKPNGLDLSSYDQVKKKAKRIYARLNQKEMPCDQPWTDDELSKLKQWIGGGMKR